MNINSFSLLCFSLGEGAKKKRKEKNKLINDLTFAIEEFTLSVGNTRNKKDLNLEIASNI